MSPPPQTPAFSIIWGVRFIFYVCIFHEFGHFTCMFAYDDEHVDSHDYDDATDDHQKNDTDIYGIAML